MPNELPRNAYTDAPEQHPNLILGSLQLLFWIFFRPSAWRNHLTRIFTAPDFASDRTSRLLSEFLIQVHLVLPLLANLMLGLLLWRLGNSAVSIPVWVAWGVAWSVWWHMGLILMPLGINRRSMTLPLVEWVVVSLLTAIVGLGMVFVAVSVGWVVWGMILLLVAIYLGALGFFGKFQWIWFFGFIGLNSVLSVVLLYLVLGLPIGLPMLGMGVTINLWRPVVLYPFVTPFNILLYQLDKRRTDHKTILRWHSAFWDELQRIPLYGLDKYLVLVMDCNSVEAEVAINYLSHTNQSWAVQAAQIELEKRGLEGFSDDAINYLSTSQLLWAAQPAQIELDGRRLERCVNIQAIGKANLQLGEAELEGLASAIVLRFGRISEDVETALNHTSVYNQRQTLSLLADSLNLLFQDLTRSNEKSAVRFRPIAKSWIKIITNYIEELVKATELRQEIDNPYIIGVPLNEQLAIFTGRTSIGLRIEQLLLDRRRPPLLLYGQRRMGKTSLLNNLGKLLPNSIIPMFVDLQGAPSSASNHAGFLYNLARGMITSAKRQSALTLPSLTREELEKDPFTSFDEWLDKVEQALQDNTALLSLDEFEVLDNAITKARFDEQDVLGMLRNLIQHRPKFKVLIAGSHTIQEYQRWASYLINVQVVHISYFKEDEARQLIERPVKDFTLRYESDAVERVLQLTRCHPFLVQLLCAEIVALKNEQNPSVRRLANLADVGAGIPAAFSSGGFFFADIQNNQVDAAGLAILRFIATLGEGAIVTRKALLQEFPDVGESTFNLLLQRELIEEVGEGYRFQVELIRQWFAQK